ncbi:hypothetical protein Poli38472_003726 [Pythium oligandrum]|uniref:Uncharacterized protein n=1 Tax=Pythium oligandrum TaxID=41045 RepID=A0A8K1CLR8_PYTOL|nr:hypothetical protein Poli38472_003726 [Pythium oligandrum]|eukprot:TMW65961.1 hypothetical protein Poli38472_003726 [Pythium oligandrum]
MEAPVAEQLQALSLETEARMQIEDDMDSQAGIKREKRKLEQEFAVLEKVVRPTIKKLKELDEMAKVVTAAVNAMSEVCTSFEANRAQCEANRKQIRALYAEAARVTKGIRQAKRKLHELDARL